MAIAALPSSAEERSRYSPATRRCSATVSPAIVEALASLGDEFVLDGELVAIDPRGRPFSFCKTPCLGRFRFISTPSIC